LSSSIPNLVGVGGSAMLSNLSAGAALNLDMGLTLDGNFTPILYDSTGLTLTASASATNIDFQATLGGFLGIFVNQGTVTLDADGSGPSTAPAKFSLKMMDASANGHRYDLGAVKLSDAQITLDAGIDADLPLYFPTISKPLGN